MRPLAAQEWSGWCLQRQSRCLSAVEMCVRTEVSWGLPEFCFVLFFKAQVEFPHSPVHHFPKKPSFFIGVKPPNVFSPLCGDAVHESGIPWCVCRHLWHWAWWLVPVIPALERLKQEKSEFERNLGRMLSVGRTARLWISTQQDIPWQSFQNHGT